MPGATAPFRKTVLSVAVATATAALAAPAVSNESGGYRTGDFHNHTTCSDGSTSVKTLTREALDRHDWFIHVGHSGRGPRDCRVSDFLYHSFGGGSTVGLWSNTLREDGSPIPGAIKGDVRERTIQIPDFDAEPIRDESGNIIGYTNDEAQTVQDMWRWQSLQEFNLPSIVEERELPDNDNKAAFLGLEWVVPGHEHSSNTISAGQYEEAPNADALAQFEYCFARNSDDTSQGGGQGWTCEISEESNNRLIALFSGRPEEGIADYNSTLVDGINTVDDGEHVKAAAAMLWKQENYADESFHVHAHIERQGAFVPGGNRGWNVEHIRDMNTLAPEISVGMETQPGHQAAFDRGTYSAGRPTAGLVTYGGTGAYGAAEITQPGTNFDGTPLTQSQCEAAGVSSSRCDSEEDLQRVVLSRPGIRTMWDALLSEGRRFWFFGSSDWHNRGSFGPLDFESTLDFWPGEYQDNYVYVNDNNPEDPAKDIVAGVKSGNTFVVQGQLIDRMKFKACSRGRCATMGETLNVRKGDLVKVILNVRDPRGENRSPYAFPNPSLAAIGIEQPLNKPELAHVELIKGQVNGLVSPSDAEYYSPLAPSSTRIVAHWNEYDWGQRPTKRMAWAFRAFSDSYIRARGSNIPPGTPNERDAFGNPLADNLSDNIPCEDRFCPPHIEGQLDADVEAWADIWFHSNPIFIEVGGRGEGDGSKAKKPESYMAQN